MDALDPVLARACGAAIAVVLLTGAWQKLRDMAVFEASVDLYRLLPDGLVPLFARGFPLLEALAGTALLFGVVLNLLRGHTTIDCGCGGADGHTTLSWALPARNAVLLLVAVLGGQDGSGRALMWIDYLSVAGGTLALVGLYATANQLMANHPRLIQLRN